MIISISFSFQLLPITGSMILADDIYFVLPASNRLDSACPGEGNWYIKFV